MRTTKPLFTNWSPPVPPKRFPELSVILPAHNEALCIADTVNKTLQGLERMVEQYEILVVNDGSTDTTATVLDALQERLPALRVVTHRMNRGYGSALRSGFLAARYAYVFFMDSDGQFLIDDLERLLPHASPTTIVAGYRENRRDARYRAWNAMLWNRLIRLLFGVRVRDLDCAYKVFPRRLLERTELFAQGAFINAELLIHARRLGYQLAELPVRHFPRNSGASSGAKPKVILRAFRELIDFYRKNP